MQCAEMVLCINHILPQSIYKVVEPQLEQWESEENQERWSPMTEYTEKFCASV